MFFKKIDPNCEYCKFGRLLSNGEDCDCQKLGLVHRIYDCKKFVYDPLKRIPKQPKSIEQYTEEDFNIN